MVLGVISYPFAYKKKVNKYVSNIKSILYIVNFMHDQNNQKNFSLQRKVEWNPKSQHLNENSNRQEIQSETHNGK